MPIRRRVSGPASFYINRAQGRSFKELIAFILGALVCWYWKFDTFSILMAHEHDTLADAILAGAIIAGGSKASIKLFRDMFQFRSTAEQQRLKVSNQGQVS